MDGRSSECVVGEHGGRCKDEEDVALVAIAGLSKIGCVGEEWQVSGEEII
jgi:hypothetical protein